MDSIKCPHCGKKVEISEAIVHELQEEVREEEQKRLKVQFEKEKADELIEKEKQVRKQIEHENKDKDKELEIARRDKKVLEEKIADEKEERDRRELKIREEESEKSRLDKLAYEKKLSDMQKSLEDAQRKGRQGSQQLQGEVLELDLEEKLKEIFKEDQFVPIPKGVEGADIWQKVVYKGNVVGSILWETKRTKAFSKGWIAKLKDDAAKINASESIIITKTLPEDVSNFDRKGGVWIASYEHAISLCRYVRFLITTVSTIKKSSSKTDEEWEQVRDYMLSDAFRHRMQAHFDSIKTMRDSMEAEKRSTILRWKKQESQIEKLDINTTNFYGELKAIVSELPAIDGVDQEYLPDASDNEETLL